MRKQSVILAVAITLAVHGCSSQEEEPALEEPNKETETEPVSTNQQDKGAENEEAPAAGREAVSLKVDDQGLLSEPDDTLALVNKEYRLPADYQPNDLTVPDVPFPFEENHPKKQLREPAARALENLFADAEKEGFSLFAVSGYRSYDRQEAIYTANVEADGEEAANQYSAKPGESEHQTGLSMDVSSLSNDFGLTTEFGETPEGQWLKENAHRHGFIIRYPEGKTEITNYQYEPWHIRYVGDEAATIMYEDNLTLEEYYGLSGKE
ncbi:M15 family metallopeptidase [Alteribacillus iranensis]|uniref:D-Ala-D-Ala carboxypeptidase. Metallo peptidase. MEROPS family M15B n=1 Tax=Alteribacillus iranensis TaxID=930128 RepID=A0A1I2DUN7_9BACI|nr:M15 family metallopeptidase [Alteribacillus iranensis]SFE84138.1 D-Ala-D-Ala carboxypeptidase. Metallo peptidase. MEROPS family M15B [Alteribacillus iranensis]